MDGYQVARLEDVVADADIFITTTGSKDVITVEHMAPMKHQAIVGNIGHFDNEIDMAGLDRTPGRAKTHQAAGARVALRRRTLDHRAQRGSLLNLGNATGHPSFVMSDSFTNQTIAQIELFTRGDEYPLGVYVLPKHLDEKVARLHLDALGVAHRADQTRPSTRCPRRGPVQARALPLLIGATPRAAHRETSGRGFRLVCVGSAAPTQGRRNRDGADSGGRTL